mmetsp:Transcript_36361/g.115694  ORF Transcript_36361/g.115694 Transcript_36361/m.115694 type:complete len:467 (+) Transcript_36361:2822-4222(+)
MHLFAPLLGVHGSLHVPRRVPCLLARPSGYGCGDAAHHLQLAFHVGSLAQQRDDTVGREAAPLRAVRREDADELQHGDNGVVRAAPPGPPPAGLPLGLRRAELLRVGRRRPACGPLLGLGALLLLLLAVAGMRPLPRRALAAAAATLPRGLSGVFLGRMHSLRGGLRSEQLRVVADEAADEVQHHGARLLQRPGDGALEGVQALLGHEDRWHGGADARGRNTADVLGAARACHERRERRGCLAGHSVVCRPKHQRSELLDCQRSSLRGGAQTTLEEEGAELAEELQGVRRRHGGRCLLLIASGIRHLRRLRRCLCCAWIPGTLIETLSIPPLLLLLQLPAAQDSEHLQDSTEDCRLEEQAPLLLCAVGHEQRQVCGPRSPGQLARVAADLAERGEERPHAWDALSVRVGPCARRQREPLPEARSELRRARGLQALAQRAQAFERHVLDVHLEVQREGTLRSPQCGP